MIRALSSRHLLLPFSRILFRPYSMALPASFENPEDFFQDCVTFLKEYQYLYNFPNTDILVNDALKHIDVPNLETLDVFNKDFKLPSEKFLNNFFEKLAKLTAVHDEFKEVGDLENAIHIPCGVTPKKRHEIIYLAKEVKEVCEENGCDVVVDFGSGLGYLDQIIFETTTLRVLGLECNTSHYVGAKKRQGKYHPSSTEKVKYIKHTIDENSNISIEQFLHDKFLGCNGFCIAGLHACADLTVVALDLFLKLTEAKAMVIMPCCYHKMEIIDGRFKNFPLSNGLKEVYERCKGFEFMGVPFLRLGAQPPCWDDDLEDSVFNLLSRAVLQMYASKHNSKLKRNKRKAVKIKTINRNFQTYIHDACTGFRLIQNEPSSLENKVDSSETSSNLDFDELITIWREIESSMVFQKAAIFILIQNHLQPVIENLILYDRLVYLKEKGLNNCKFKRIVNERISPRCMALLACKI